MSAHNQPDPELIHSGYASKPTMAAPNSGDAFSSAEANAEGWDVFDCGRREDGSARAELRRVDCPENLDPVFPNDQEAWEHVVAKARAGSTLHLQGLRHIDPVERFLIETHCGSWPSA